MFINKKLQKKEEAKTDIYEQVLEDYVKDKGSLEPEEIYEITLNLCKAIENIKIVDPSLRYIKLEPSNLILLQNKKIKLRYFRLFNINADIYSIGVIIFFMATGRVPFTVLEPYFDETSIVKLDYSLKRIIRKCFALNDQNKYISIQELRADISLMLLQSYKYREKLETYNTSETLCISTKSNALKELNKSKVKGKEPRFTSYLDGILTVLQRSMRIGKIRLIFRNF